jgi:hypothetical protein
MSGLGWVTTQHNDLLIIAIRWVGTQPTRLEKAGKTKAAIDNYSEIVKDFGATPAATEAKARLKALGK